MFILKKVNSPVIIDNVSKRHNLIIGFHGCDEFVRDKIVKCDEKQIESKNDYDWLGNGMYFWEYNYARALDYAKQIHNKPHRTSHRIEKPSVLGAVIDLGYCLDLLDASSLNIVKNAYILLKNSAKKAGYALPQNISPIGKEKDLLIRRLDCAVIEMVHKLNKDRPFDSVRSVFFEGNFLYKKAGFKEKNHIQICVRNPNNILGYFIPRNKIG